MSKPSLLPPNSTALERDLEQSMARLEDVPVPLRTLWNPLTCPANLLPWLAWVVSVDEWNPSWTVAQKRGVIANSFAVHRRKGTIGAVKQAIAALGLPILVQEWFEYGGAPYTARLEIELVDGMGNEGQRSILRVAEQAKNLRTHLTLRMITPVIGRHRMANGQLLSDVITVANLAPTEPSEFVPWSDALNNLDNWTAIGSLPGSPTVAGNILTSEGGIGGVTRNGGIGANRGFSISFIAAEFIDGALVIAVTDESFNGYSVSLITGENACQINRLTGGGDSNLATGGTVAQGDTVVLEFPVAGPIVVKAGAVTPVPILTQPSAENLYESANELALMTSGTGFGGPVVVAAL